MGLTHERQCEWALFQVKCSMSQRIAVVDYLIDILLFAICKGEACFLLVYFIYCSLSTLYT